MTAIDAERSRKRCRPSDAIVINGPSCRGAAEREWRLVFAAQGGKVNRALGMADRRGTPRWRRELEGASEWARARIRSGPALRKARRTQADGKAASALSFRSGTTVRMMVSGVKGL